MKTRKTGFLKKAFELSSIVVFLASCSNPTQQVIKSLNIISNPNVAFEVYIDGNLYQTPVHYTAQTGEKLVVVAADTVEKDSSNLFNGPDERYVFQEWKNGSLQKTQSITLVNDTTIQFNILKQCKVQTAVTPLTINTIIQGSGWYVYGDSAKFIAPAVDGYAFNSWTVNGLLAGNNDTLDIQVLEPLIVTAVYHRIFKFSILASSDTGLQVQLDSISYPLPKYISCVAGSVFTVQMVSPQEKDLSTLVSGPDTRYTFASWSDFETANPREILVDKDISLTPRMQVTCKLETETNPTGIGIVQGAGWREKGSMAVLTAPSISGYVFNNWEINALTAGNDATISISMDGPKKVVAFYSQGFHVSISTKPDPSLALIIDGIQDTAPANISRLSGASLAMSAISAQEKDLSANVAGTDVRYFFSKWENGDTSSTRTITVTRDTTLFLQFSRQFKILTACSPAGMVTIGGSGWYRDGDTVVLAAPQVSNSVFDHWEINGIVTSIKDTLTCVVDNPKNITAFYRPLYNLSLTTYPVSGLQVTLNGSAFVSPTTQVITSNTTVTVGAASLTEIDADSNVSGTDTRYTFATWNDMVTANPRNIVVDKDISLTAQMGVKYKIETAVLPSGITTPGGSAWYDNGTSISMTAPAIAKYTFDHWEIGNAFYSSDSAISFIIDKPKKIVARYKPVFNFTLTTSPDAGITLQVNGKAYTSQASVTIIDTATVTIQASSQIIRDISNFVSGNDATYSFLRWSDGNTTNPRTLFINKDTSITAVMLAKYKVETATSPDSIGPITTDVVPDTAGYYARGATVTFTAPYKQFYVLDHWEVNGANAGISDSIVVNINGPRRVVAVYQTLFFESSGFPTVYKMKLNEVTLLHSKADTSGSTPLPNSLIIPPQKYTYAGKTYDFSDEGLYRLFMETTGDHQQRIVYAKDINVLMSSLAWIAVVGETDMVLSNSQRTEKAKTNTLLLYCYGISDWADYLLKGLGLQSRMVNLYKDMGSTVEGNHTAIEVFNGDYQRWVFYDLNRNLVFEYNNTPISFLELVSLINSGRDYNIQFIAQDANNQIDPSGSISAFENERLVTVEELKNYYSNLFLCPFLTGNSNNSIVVNVLSPKDITSVFSYD
jgi:hypothetical protein